MIAPLLLLSVLDSVTAWGALTIRITLVVGEAPIEATNLEGRRTPAPGALAVRAAQAELPRVLARALATSPRLLVVDEPAAGLNAAEVEKLLDRITQLRAGGMTVVIVEHNMDLVMKVADRVLVMDYGQYLFEGAPAEAQVNPDVIAAYLGA